MSVESPLLPASSSEHENGDVQPERSLSVAESGHIDEDRPEISETASECSLDSTDVGKMLDEQNLDLEEENFHDFFNERSATTSIVAKRDGSLPTSEYWSCSPDTPVKIRVKESGFGSEPPQTVVSLFNDVVGNHGEHMALAVKREGEWKMWTYRKYYVDCFTVAKAMVELGLEPSHGVCILGFNSPEWHISSIATIMAGGLSVGLYLTSTAEACYNFALDCRANIFIVENDNQLQKILQVKDRLPDLKAIVQFTKEVTVKDPMVYDWKQIMNLGTTISDSKLRPRLDSLRPDMCCSIIYTSGTSGTSKGVMLSHDNFTWMCRRVRQYVNCVIGEEHVVSYLPLSHVATQLLDIYTTMVSAGTCWFAQPDALKGSLINTMKEVRPTIFLGVPRVWEKIAEGLQLIGRSSKGLKAKIASWAKGVGYRANYAKQSGQSATPFGWSIAKALVFKKVHKALGLDRCHFPITGAAPTNEETLAYFMSINLPLHEIYGMSETTGPTTVTTTDLIRYLSVGRVFDGAEIKIDQPDSDGQGEVLIRGRHVFMGYLGRPDATREAFTSDGWLCSGDVGYISKDNYVYITGRKKELIITAGGEKIAPVPIEGLIKQTLPVVSNALVVGDQQKYLSCLLTLRVEMDDTTGLPTNKLTEVAMGECKKVGSNAQTVDDVLNHGGDHRVLKMLQKGIDTVNKKAPSKIHKIARWSILERDFSIAGGELTPTMKLKRPVIMMKYLDSIESFYNS